MELTSLKTKNKKRIGRGLSAGQGKTAGRGTKGQKSRSGFNLPNRFEGGQTPLSMRLPKLPGFRSVSRKDIVITLDTISKNYKAGETVSAATLIEKGLIKSFETAKILSTGALTVAVKLAEDIKVSAGAKKIVEGFKAETPKAEKTEEKVATEKKPAAKKTTKKAE